MRASLHSRALAKPIGALLVVLIGIIVSLPTQSYDPQQVVSLQQSLDPSWQYSMPVLLADGELSGRDFIYTYGPLYQLSHALGILVPPGDLATVIRFHDVPEVVLSLLSVWWILGLAGARFRHRAVVYLTWAVLLAAPASFHATHLKPMGGLALVVLCGTIAAASPKGPKRGWHLAVVFLAWAMVPPMMTLYSFEFGIVGLATLLFLAAWILFSSFAIAGGEARWLRKRGILGGLGAVAGSACFVLVMLLWEPWRAYLPNLLTFVRYYSYSLAHRGSFLGFSLLLLSLIGASGGLLLAGHQMRKRIRRGVPAIPELTLVATCCFCIVILRYGLTRSDPSHVFRAVVPTLFLWGCLLPVYFHEKSRAKKSVSRAVRASNWRTSIVWGSTFLLPLVVMGPVALSSFFERGWKDRIRSAKRFSLAQPRIELAEPSLEWAVKEAERLPGDSLFVWPYGVVMNLLANKANPTYTLQSLEASVGPLQGLNVRRLRELEDLPVLILRNANLLDGISSVSRNSLIFRYLLESYELSAPPRPVFSFLQRGPASERRWEEIHVPVPADQNSLRPTGNDSIEIALPEDCHASDLLLVRLRASKTSMVPVGKPGRLTATIFVSDETRFVRPLLLPPDGNTHEIFLSVLDLDSPIFFSAFAQGKWLRSTERMNKIQLRWERLDWLSRRPEKITLEDVAIFRRQGVESLEIPLKDEISPEVLGWCYQPR